MEDDSTSGASTVPLTAPLQQQQQYLQLVNEATAPSPPSSSSYEEPYETPISIFNKDIAKIFPEERAAVSGRCVMSPCSADGQKENVYGCETYTSTNFDSAPSDVLLSVPPRSIESIEGRMKPSVGGVCYSNSVIDKTTQVASSKKDKNSSPNSFLYEYCQPRPKKTSTWKPRVTPVLAIASAPPFGKGRQNSLPNFCSSSRMRKASLSSLPSSPRSPNQTGPFISPSPDSPLSVTFTFPTTVLPKQPSADHYLKPANNRSCEALPEGTCFVEADGSLEELNLNGSVHLAKSASFAKGNSSESPFSDKIQQLNSSYNPSYISMSGGIVASSSMKNSCLSNGFINESFNDACQSQKEAKGSFYTNKNDSLGQNLQRHCKPSDLPIRAPATSSLTCGLDSSHSRC